MGGGDVGQDLGAGRCEGDVWGVKQGVHGNHREKGGVDKLGCGLRVTQTVRE